MGQSQCQGFSAKDKCTLFPYFCHSTSGTVNLLWSITMCSNFRLLCNNSVSISSKWFFPFFGFKASLIVDPLYLGKIPWMQISKKSFKWYIFMYFLDNSTMLMSKIKPFLKYHFGQLVNTLGLFQILMSSVNLFENPRKLYLSITTSRSHLNPFLNRDFWGFQDHPLMSLR